MQDIKRQSWERKIQTQTQEYVSRFEPLLYVPAFTRRISTIHYKIFHKGTFTEKLQIQIGSTQLQLSHTSAQELGTK